MLVEQLQHEFKLVVEGQAVHGARYDRSIHDHLPHVLQARPGYPRR
jgi:hypothetical protein